MKFNPQILIFLCFLSIYFCRNSLKQNINTSKLVNSTFKISKNHWSTKAFCFSKIDFYIFDLYKLGYLENFSINDERKIIFQLIYCQLKSSVEIIRVNAMKCLVEIQKNFYDYLIDEIKSIYDFTIFHVYYFIKLD